jgi:hypothetical protein
MKDYNEFEKLMSFGSMHNKDAFGLFNSNYWFKQSKIFNPEKLKINKILEDNWIVGHNRFSTSGFFGEGNKLFSFKGIMNSLIEAYTPEWILNKGYYENKREKNNIINHHPFVLGDFILVHNGIINNAEELRKKYSINSDIKTDSYVIIYLINYYFNINKEKNREKRLYNSIKMTTKNISGSYSIFLYDKKINKLYYFKNFMTYFNIYRIGKRLVGSTDDRNIKYIYFGEEKIKLNIEDNNLYLIEEKIKKIGELEEKIFEYSREEMIKDYLRDIFEKEVKIKLKKDKVYIKVDEGIKIKRLKVKYKIKNGLLNRWYIIDKNIFNFIK